MRSRLRLHFVAVLVAVASLACSTQGLAQADPLPSWNDGAGERLIDRDGRDVTKRAVRKGRPLFLPSQSRGS